MSDIDELAKKLASSEFLGFGSDSWNGLTFGEQQQYRKEACRTAGAVYKSSVTERTISFSVELPESLRLSGLTEKEAAGHEAYLHKKMEDAIVWILEWRSQRGPFSQTAEPSK